MSSPARIGRQAVLRAIELFYGPLAPLYPLLTRLLFGSEWHEWRRSVEPWIDGADLVADIGCGPAELAAELADEGRRVIAIDRSPAMLRVARRHTGRRARGGRLWLLCADARVLPLRDRTLDAVVMTYPTAVFLDASTHSEIARVLRPDGVFVAVVGVRPKRWPLWLRPCVPLLRRIVSLDPADPASAWLVPPTPGFVSGDWIRYEHPTGTLLLWLARAAGSSGDGHSQ
ncbi:MAG: class I SAM-dependent methyltransferase [Thermomicrobium sp.]|nr:class I SAM-dependent methyltransferase [Thermomicrobium sp.]